MLNGIISENSGKTQALDQLKLHTQWVNYIFLTRGQKVTKPPINPGVPLELPLKERLADATDPKTWGTYEQALHCYQKGRYKVGYKGIGFVFSNNDPFTGIDLDHCRDKETGRIAPWAKRIILLLDSYTELSPREEGFHITIQADLIATADAIGLTDIQHKKGDIEIYSEGRYFTWTGRHLNGTPTTIEDRQDELNHLYFETFCMNGEEDEKHEERETVQQSTPSVRQEQPLPEDAELIALASQASGGRGLRFQRLWAGDASDYRAPSGDVDESRADQALLGILAYWTQRDAYRMERLYKQSGLYSGKPDRQRKWDARARSGETYGEGSIRMAVASCTSTYDPNWRPAGWLPYEEYVARKAQQKKTTGYRRQPTPEGEESPQCQFLGKHTFPHVSSSARQVETPRQESMRGGQRS